MTPPAERLARRCGAHRPGIGREWCYDDQEWCYPDEPCRGCALAQALTALDAAEALAAAVFRFADERNCHESHRKPLEQDMIDKARAVRAVRAAMEGR